MNKNLQTITVIDVETGGLSYTDNPITEIALLNFNLHNFKVNWTYKTFVKPYHDLIIDPIVYKKTMVTPEDVANGKTNKAVLKEICELFKKSNTCNGKPQGNTILLGHNVVGFDRLFLEMFFLLEEKDLYEFVSGEYIDTLPLVKSLWPTETKFNLGVCCERIKYNLVGAHGAMNDVNATFYLYKHIVERMRNITSTNTITQTIETENEFRKSFNF